MVNGIRTIKSYGWENHYKQKIFEAREQQEKEVWWVNFFGSMGLTVFNNFGFYAYLVIVAISYKRGIELKAGEEFATFSLLNFLFLSINGLTNYALVTVYQFLAICVRLGDVFKLSEHKSLREDPENPQNVCIKV